MAPITIPSDPPPRTNSVIRDGIVIGPAEIAQLPMSGATWSGGTPTRGVAHFASQDISNPPVAGDKDSDKPVFVFARALVYKRDPAGFPGYATDVQTAIDYVIDNGLNPLLEVNPALSLARKLLPIILAADVINLKTINPGLHSDFVAWLLLARTKTWAGYSNARSLIQMHEQRPNNFGTHAGASRIALDLYIGDMTDLAQASNVLRGWLGDGAAYQYPSGGGNGYSGSLVWQADEDSPVGINPLGATRNDNATAPAGQAPGNRDIDGVLPEEQRRPDPGSIGAGGFGFTWAPLRVAGDSQYVYDALQGIVVSALMLYRAGGFSTWTLQNEAIGRAFAWLNDAARGNLVVHNATYLSSQEARWLVPIINRVYGTAYVAVPDAVDVGMKPGKGFGFADWFTQYTLWPMGFITP